MFTIYHIRARERHTRRLYSSSINSAATTPGFGDKSEQSERERQRRALTPTQCRSSTSKQHQQHQQHQQQQQYQRQCEIFVCCCCVSISICLWLSCAQRLFTICHSIGDIFADISHTKKNTFFSYYLHVHVRNNNVDTFDRCIHISISIRPAKCHRCAQINAVIAAH